MHSHFRKGVH